MIARTSYLALVLVAFAASLASATTTCVFNTNSTTKRMTLTHDCTTDATLKVPAGFTLNGAKHLITTLDPAGGNFQGPVVANASVNSAINVRNLMLDAPNLAAGNCAAIAGISYNQASGTISGNTVLHIGQGSTCPGSGYGISVVVPYGSPAQAVTISGNQVLLASGDALYISGLIDATVSGNQFSINSAVNYVLFFQGHSGSITQNQLETDANGYNQQAFIAFGNSSTVKFISNTINLIAGTTGMAVDVYMASNPVTVSSNRIFNHGTGVSSRGVYNSGPMNIITNNQIRCYEQPISGAAGKGNVTLPCPF